MAAKALSRGEAVVWVPPRSAGERALASSPSLTVLAAGAGDQVQMRRVSLESLPAVRQVRLVFDARDVTMLRPTLPALSTARLRRALPGLLEDQLLQDTQACAFAMSRTGNEDGSRAVAVIDRDWFETVVQAFERRGINVTAAVPAQLLRPQGEGVASLLCINDGVALLDGSGGGLGLSATADTPERAVIIQTLLSRMTATGSVIAFADDEGWDEALALAGKASGVRLERRPLPVASPGTLDLMDARRGRGAGQWLADIDWQAWRPAVVLASASALIAVVGLNVQAWQMRQERDALRASVEMRFRQAFPGVSVIVDPVLQMQRQVTQLRTAAGQQGADDFVPLLSRFAQALGPQSSDVLASLDFREGKLRVRFRGGLAESRGAREALVEACRRHGLRMQLDTERDAGALVTLLR